MCPMWYYIQLYIYSIEFIFLNIITVNKCIKICKIRHMYTYHNYSSGKFEDAQFGIDIH